MPKRCESLIEFRSLPGLVSYEQAQRLQKDLVQQRVRDEIPDTVLFLEHEPVITQGRGLQWSAKSQSKSDLVADLDHTQSRTQADRHSPVPTVLPSGVSFATSERGGDLTYHGPGQLVIYPICKLDGTGFGPKHDLGLFLRRLEHTAIKVIKRIAKKGESEPGQKKQSLSSARLAVGQNGLDLDLGVRSDATGVWMGSQKVGSIGIAVRRWVTYHGIALNCVNDLSPFFSISPCGFAPEVMTRLGDWMELGLDWRAFVEDEFKACMLDVAVRAQSEGANENEKSKKQADSCLTTPLDLLPELGSEMNGIEAQNTRSPL